MSTNSDTVTLTLRIRQRWWLKWWIRLVLAVYRLTGWAPSEETRERIIKRGIRVETLRCPT